MQKEIEERYIKLFGFIPENIQKRFELAEKSKRSDAFETIELFRQKLIYENPLDTKTQQMIHFALLIGAGHSGPALYHVKGAIKAGATVEELFGICETAAVTGGMPAFTMAIDMLYEAVLETESTL